MPTIIIDGKQHAADLNAETKHEIAELTRPEVGYRKPGLAVILVGDDPASQTYVNAKRKVCTEVGVQCEVHELPATTSEAKLVALIDRLNTTPHVDGILLQLPLPNHLYKDNIIPRIDPQKDVDGIHPYNMGLLATGNPRLIACTPAGIMHLLYKTGQDLTGKKVLIIGYSDIVGKPLSMLLLQQGATVTCCTITVKNLRDEVKKSDVVIAAAGVLGLVKSHWLKRGSTVIDVGMHRTETGLKGDVEVSFNAARYITPVPGGVGPMTVAMVARNTHSASVRMQQRNNPHLDKGIFPLHRLQRKRVENSAIADSAAPVAAQNGNGADHSPVKRVKIDLTQRLS